MNWLRYLGVDLMVLMHLWTYLFPTIIAAVDPYCDYYQTMNTVSTYYVYNKEYPNNYGRNQNCRWIAVAPAGYVVEAICQFEMPNSVGCVDERVLISRTGHSELENAEVFCGYGNKTIVSEGTTMSIGLQSSYRAIGGRFMCSLKATINTPPQCDCGWKNMRRIVGGVETKVNEYPMMAALIDFNVRDVFCGATIIASKYALSAAHCFKNKNPSIVGLLIGDHNITSGAETDAARLLQTINFILHENYDERTSANDIALVETASSIEYNWAIGPACLPIYYYQNSFAGDTVEVLGWGTTEFTGPSSDVLLKTDLDVLNYQECSSRGNGTPQQMCTYRSGHDSCQKDSGGPVLWHDSQTYRLYLVGIISNGYGCASVKPGINTRVTSYLTWILGHMKDANICVKGP